MNSKTFVSAVLALSLVTGGSAFAQGHEGHHDRGRHEQSRGDDQRDRRDNEGRQQDRHEERGGRGAGPNQQFYRGDRLPAEYRHRQYVVDDWRGHRLSAPPRGYHWVQSGDDYILIAIASGIIAQILLGH